MEAPTGVSHNTLLILNGVQGRLGARRGACQVALFADQRLMGELHSAQQAWKFDHASPTFFVLSSQRRPSVSAHSKPGRPASGKTSNLHGPTPPTGWWIRSPSRGSTTQPLCL